MVLLDEVEKAHPEVFDILLQVLDDGRLNGRPGPYGRLPQHDPGADVQPGQPVPGGPDGSEAEKRNKRSLKIRASFKPEFLNRLDDLVVFSA